jgi:hypothetical protein
VHSTVHREYSASVVMHQQVYAYLLRALELLADQEKPL